MGWCQAFGPQIRDGCDHSMVAGRESCSCPECGVVCPGRFAGCTSVWADGPQQVSLRRPASEPGAVKALPTSASNGPRSQVHSPASISASPVSYPVNAAGDLNGDLRPLLHALRAELQVLSRKVDQIQQAQHAGDSGQFADQALAATEALPGRIAKAVAEALREQHRAMQLELGVLRVQLAADIESVHEALEQSTGSQPILAALDARFEWLTKELSARFVIFGNELARVDRLGVAQQPIDRTVESHLHEALAPLVAEVERLARTLTSPGSGAVTALRRR